MNAPFKMGMGAGRDMFQAYACDDNTAAITRSVAVEMGWDAERVYKGGLRNAVQSLSVSASPHVLFVDMSESIDPLNDINGLAEVCEPGTIVIACGQVNDVRLYRDLLGSGIQDYLLKPLNAEHLRETFASAQAAFLAPRLEGGDMHSHIATAVIGVRGGVGASTVATSLAWLLSENAKRPTALLDLDLHFGTGALTLDLEPGRGLIDAIENPSRIDGLFIERAMVRASDTLALLSAEAPIHQPMLTDGGAFHQLEEEFRSVFGASVIDMPRHMLIQFPHLMVDYNVGVVVTEITLAGARDTIRLLSWLRSNAPQMKVIVVANKVQANALEISRKDFEQSIERKIDISLPYDMRLAAQAAKLGKTLAEVSKSSKLGASYAEALSQVLELGGADGTVAEPKKGGSLIGKLEGLKGMLPKKGGKAKAEA
ncbi:pilus assembly protein CpaE [Sphingobium fluviale]|uniref:Pilus assembly protein CpaE n=1 Tax=Sphingobium fluviale TaxID=2506423 RepID=A0A4Q1KDV1_9SPHN|nr:pilus assembly protein CpaE [Sphingobium fluviale]RXR26522.1 pilus assembly protein CpaE [Sphingobium fluviale]